MSDLISRSALYNKLVELETLARNRVLDTPINNPCYQRYVSLMNERTRLKELVADLPTAYDVDKVVEELEKKRIEVQKMKNDCIALSDMEACDIESITYDRAIDIVKRGGIE